MRIAPAMLAGRVVPATLAMLASLIATSFAAPATPVMASAAKAQHCTQWSSTTEPPPTIRVYRVREHKVDTVDFKDYVIRVVSREWNVKQTQLRKAGAVAVKQYAWFHVLHYRGGSYNGECFDVRDTTADQLYSGKSIHRIPHGVKSAVNSTWTWSVQRDGSLPMTGYRRGRRRDGCAKDGGYRLYVRSARKCAEQGWSAEEILARYFSGTVVGVDVKNN